MRAELLSLLLSDAVIAGIVGNRGAWFELPRANALPAFILRVISPGRSYSMGGPVCLDFPRIQIDAFAKSAPQAHNLAVALRTAMERGGIGQSVLFHPAFQDSLRDAPVIDEADGSRIFQITADYKVHHELVI